MKRNIIANYVGQAYSFGIVIITTPLYIKYLGIDQYGLIGIFVLMQNLLNLLDAGFSPTLGREVAYAKGTGIFRDVFKLGKTIEALFLLIFIFILLFFYFFSNSIAQNWIKSSGGIDKNVISNCIFIMGIIIGFRFFSTMYKSGLNGFEDQVWINLFNIVIVTLKYFGSLFFIMLISSDIANFFKYQLVIGCIEFVFYARRFYVKLDAKFSFSSLIIFDTHILRKVLPYSLGVAYLTIINTLLLQADKFFLSKFLPLKEFAYLSVITLLSGTLFAVATPLFLAITPKITALFSQKNETMMRDLYSTMTQLVIWILTPTCLLICFYSKEILYCFTHSLSSAIWGKNILIFYVLGNGFMILSSFQYYLQSAFGNLKIYVRLLTIGAIIYLPIMIEVVINYYAIGASILWFVFNVIVFIIVTPIVHNKLLRNFHLQWLIKDVFLLIIIIFTISISFYIFIHIDINSGKVYILSKLIFMYLFLLIFSMFFVKKIRESFIKNIL